MGIKSTPRTPAKINYDVNVANYLSIGEAPGPTSKKSFGYPSTFEHNFQYIDDDMQKPEHVVMERPFPTRIFNKTVARPKYQREILM